MISYKKLLYLLVDKNMKLYVVCKEVGLSPTVAGRIKKGQSIEVGSLEKICLHLGVNIGDVCDILPDAIE